MSLKVVGAGVGRTGTNSLKVALEQLLGGPCHHMFEIVTHPAQMPEWTNAIEGGSVDWSTMPLGYVALVDWPGASFWPELSAANPEALVLLSLRDPESWYRVELDLSSVRRRTSRDETLVRDDARASERSLQ